MLEPHASLPLRDIIAPLDQGWWPPAPGWWLVAVIVVYLVWLLTRALVKYFTYEFTALRKAALNELASLQQQTALSDHQFAEQVSALLKRVAVVRYSEHQPALLSGKAWLAFLDQTNPSERFSQVGGGAIEHAQYQHGVNIDRCQLADAAHVWVKSI
jgi:hypothetical protein